MLLLVRTGRRSGEGGRPLGEEARETVVDPPEPCHRSAIGDVGESGPLGEWVRAFSCASAECMCTGGRLVILRTPKGRAERDDAAGHTTRTNQCVTSASSHINLTEGHPESQCRRSQANRQVFIPG
ncbi:hypothetical protein MRX96_059111 [Rhipicephalus microplus]